MFQFHKGSIDTAIRVHRHISRGGFQFHKGSIDTLRACAEAVSFWRFQFHKGSIDTNRTGHTPRPPPGFNSIKVRLILIKSAAVGSSLLSFNSIKVRLIPVEAYDKEGELLVSIP